MKQFFVRQIWRIKETYRFFLPMIGIVNTILYFIIAVGVTNIIELTVINVIVGIVTIFLLFNISGYLLDKTNMFSKDYEKMFEGISMTSSGLLANYQALMYVKYQQMPKEEINELINDHLITKTMKDRK